jgi:multisubunit Na+/H+ antiporter MnhB subunit
MATTKFHFSEPERGLDDRVAEARLRENALARMVMAYIGTGLAFMLLPGTFLGVWNLLSISNKHAANSVSAAWIQAHGQAQVFGWIGTFILGIGFYSIPKMRRSQPFAMWAAWACWAVWSTGVLLRWVATVYEWHWRVMLPVSAGLQLLAFIAFFDAVSSHRPASSGGLRPKLDRWIFVVIAGTVGLLATLIANLAGSINVALRANSPAFGENFDQRFLVLMAWGFMVPFVWGFSAR